MMIHIISSTPFICNMYIQRHLAPQIVIILITYLLEKVCFKACFEFLKVLICTAKNGYKVDLLKTLFNSQEYNSFAVYAVTIKISMTEYHHLINLAHGWF